MRNLSIPVLFVCFCMISLLSVAQMAAVPAYPTYQGNDLGLRFSTNKVFFRVWAPAANKVELRYYKLEKDGEAVVYPMQQSLQGTWTLALPASVKGGYYTYRVNNLVGGSYQWSREVTDPYSVAVGTNGVRSAIVNLNETNPAGWISPFAATSKKKAPVIIYELQIRDASKHISSGIMHKGKYLGLTERGTKNKAGLSTGLDHIKSLGVTHVHLLPCFDFRSSDESKSDPPYNWGYDPLHYNTPEGTFSSETSNPITRIREFKQMVLAFHQAGLKVVMDVVYNHTSQSAESNFEQLAPGYYYRMNKNGSFSNASYCGNETASENPMMRKFMLESVLFWVKEYKVDGFRFDLMGIHDIETMNQIARELRKIRPDILLYGEGWTAGNSPLPDSLRALKQNVSKLEGIAVFSDEFRDGLKGSVFMPEQKGFVSGNFNSISAIEFGLKGGWSNPQQMIAYADCHDNHTLWDKLMLSNPDKTVDERIEMQKLALTLVLTSQGVPFLHAGSEFLRSKRGVENSFESPDSINAIDWDRLSQYHEVNEYVKALIAMRKTHPAFWLGKTGSCISFKEFEKDAGGLISYRIDGRGTGDSWSFVQILFNGSDEERWLDQESLQTGQKSKSWMLFAENNKVIRPAHLVDPTKKIKVAPHSATILYQQ